MSEILPVSPPLAPMLGRRVDELLGGDWVYEPKWDRFRCLAFRAGAGVDLRSRHDRPLGRYFPELVAGLTALTGADFVLDGEIVVARQAGLDSMLSSRASTRYRRAWSDSAARRRRSSSRST